MKTCQEQLDNLKAFFNDRDVNVYEKQKLWGILSALRGPDGEPGCHVKDATTAVIRMKVFGPEIHAGNPLFDWISMQDDVQDLVTIRALLDRPNTKSQHFVSHVREAFHHLGLYWLKPNKM